MSVGVSAGTFSYSIGRLSQYSPIPASGSVTVTGNRELEVYFINNSTTVGYVKQMVDYFDANWNYSSSVLSTFSYTADNASHYCNDSAQGTMILNNTTFSFTFNRTELNSTTGFYYYSTIDLINTTWVSRNSTSQNQSWTNTTTLNDTLRLNSGSVSQNVTKYSSSDYLNRSLKIVSYNSELNNPYSTSYRNSTGHYPSYESVTKLSSGDENISYNISAPDGVASGYELYGELGGSPNVVSANVTGYIVNGSAKGNFTIDIEDGNGTLSLKSDPINITNLDPNVNWRSYWWGRAELAVANSIESPLPGWAVIVAAIIWYYLGEAVGIALSSGSWYLLIGGYFAFEAADTVLFWNDHANQQGQVVPYFIGGVSYSWLYGIGFWAEAGIYSNQYVPLTGGGPYTVTSQYFPFWNLYYGTGGQWVENSHISPWPAWPWSPPW